MILLLGGGAYAKEIAMLFDERWAIVDPGATSTEWEGIRIFRNLGDAVQETKASQYVPAIADPARKHRAADEGANAGLSLAPPLIHPSAYVHPTARIANGSVIYPAAAVAHHARLDECVGVLFHSSVGHDTVVGPYVTLSPSVAISGNVTIGDETFFGTNCSVREKLRIGKLCRVAMGAILTEDLPDRTNAMVNPRLMKLPIS